MKRLIVLFALVCLSSKSFSSGECRISLKTLSSKPKSFEISSCKIRGTLISVGKFLTGVFTIDTRLLTSRIPAMDFYLHEAYLDTKKYRYSSIHLKPVTIGDKKIRGLLRLNGITRDITGDIVISTSRYLESRIIINMNKFNIQTPRYQNLVFDKRLYIDMRLSR